MSKEIEKLLKDALNLSESDRALLATTLIDSLDTVNDPGSELNWEVEIMKRLEEINSGKIKMVPWTEARKKILEGLGCANEQLNFILKRS